MLVQESFVEQKDMHDPDTTDELDETLSLCDLPLYGDQSVDEWEEDLSGESQGSTSMSSSDDHDYFEFFSHELTHSTTCFPPENIIFCGKIIPYKQPDTSDTVPSKQVESKQATSIKKKRGWSLFRWRFSSKTTTLMQKKDHHHQTSKKMQGEGFPLPILTSSSSEKARWYLFLTGISRFSSEMGLRDIKSRQSRRHSPPPSPTLRFQNHHEEVTGMTGSGSSRLWEVIRVLSCGGNQHPSAMVVGSISCNRLE
ncbi:hypothetical protein C2S51_017325 [Perilla frutescens var. frutescens]|nr:hypothetical protein C2S51_017325 [Perilla frutescens var. frutescens]